MTGMDDLVTWLRAQLDEDERVARATDGQYMYPDGHADEWEAFFDRFDRARVLVEVDAKRRIIDMHYEMELDDGDVNVGTGCAECHHLDWPCETIRLLALPFADRDGYREEWRP